MKRVIAVLDLPPRRSLPNVRASFQAAATRWNAEVLWIINLPDPNALCNVSLTMHQPKTLACNDLGVSCPLGWCFQRLKRKRTATP